MRSLLTRLMLLSLLALTLTACSAARSVVGVATDLAPIQAADNRKCPELPAVSKTIRPAPGKWDMKVAVGRINSLEVLYGRCADLQERNVTQLRGDRK